MQTFTNWQTYNFRSTLAPTGLDRTLETGASPPELIIWGSPAPDASATSSDGSQQTTYKDTQGFGLTTGAYGNVSNRTAVDHRLRGSLTTSGTGTQEITKMPPGKYIIRGAWGNSNTLQQMAIVLVDGLCSGFIANSFAAPSMTVANGGTYLSSDQKRVYQAAAAGTVTSDPIHTSGTVNCGVNLTYMGKVLMFKDTSIGPSLTAVTDVIDVDGSIVTEAAWPTRNNGLPMTLSVTVDSGYITQARYAGNFSNYPSFRTFAVKAITVFNQSVSASSTTTPVGTSLRTPGRLFTFSTLASANLGRATAKRLTVAAPAIISVLSRLQGKILSAPAATGVSLYRATAKPLVAAISTLTLSSRTIGKPLPLQVSIVVSLTYQAARSLTFGAQTFFMTLLGRSVSKVLAGQAVTALVLKRASAKDFFTQAPTSANLVFSALRFAVVPASAFTASMLQRSVGKVLLLPTTSTATLNRVTSKVASTAIGLQATMVRRAAKELAVGVFVNTLMARSISFGRAVLSSVTSSASIIKTTRYVRSVSEVESTIPSVLGATLYARSLTSSVVAIITQSFAASYIRIISGVAHLFGSLVKQHSASASVETTISPAVTLGRGLAFRRAFGAIANVSSTVVGQAHKISGVVATTVGLPSVAHGKLAFSRLTASVITNAWKSPYVRKYILWRTPTAKITILPARSINTVLPYRKYMTVLPTGSQ